MFETTTYQVIQAVIFLSPNVANEGLGRDSLMVHNPGGDWHPGKGDNPSELQF